MRSIFAGLLLVTAASAIDTAAADPYRYCALYNVDGGATNCYFVTIQQCQAAISGNGGFCQPNPFFTGEASAVRKTRKHS